jgi:hypothetical protein
VRLKGDPQSHIKARILVLPESPANDQGRQLALRKAGSRKQKTEMPGPERKVESRKQK